MFSTKKEKNKIIYAYIIVNHNINKYDNYKIKVYLADKNLFINIEKYI